MRLGKKSTMFLELSKSKQGQTQNLLDKVFYLDILDIKDYFIPDIFEYIRKNSRKYGLIKFVKNDITDEGMNMILTNLRNYEYVHTLNLTSNHLTESCLDSIIEFVGYNKILKNFYLTGNNINAMKVRQKKKLMQEMGINVYM